MAFQLVARWAPKKSARPTSSLTSRLGVGCCCSSRDTTSACPPAQAASRQPPCRVSSMLVIHQQGGLSNQAAPKCKRWMVLPCPDACKYGFCLAHIAPAQRSWLQCLECNGHASCKIMLSPAHTHRSIKCCPCCHQCCDHICMAPCTCCMQCAGALCIPSLQRSATRQQRCDHTCMALTTGHQQRSAASLQGSTTAQGCTSHIPYCSECSALNMISMFGCQKCVADKTLQHLVGMCTQLHARNCSLFLLALHGILSSRMRVHPHLTMCPICRTLSFASTAAPSSNSTCTAASWPLRHATHRGVVPRSCTQAAAQYLAS